jgi:hypothetical protein
MIITNQIKDFMAHPNGILTKHHLEDYHKRTGNPNGTAIDTILAKEDINVLCFDTGWVMFRLENDVCWVESYYRHKNSKASAKSYWKAFKDMAKANGASSIIMETKIDPKFWIGNYGFKHLYTKHFLEAEL